MFYKFSARLFLFILIISIMGLFFGCAPKKEPADLVLMNGKIVTVDEAMPRAEALAVGGDQIVAVGTFVLLGCFIIAMTVLSLTVFSKWH